MPFAVILFIVFTYLNFQQQTYIYLFIKTTATFSRFTGCQVYSIRTYMYVIKRAARNTRLGLYLENQPTIYFMTSQSYFYKFPISLQCTGNYEYIVHCIGLPIEQGKVSNHSSIQYMFIVTYVITNTCAYNKSSPCDTFIVQV